MSPEERPSFEWLYAAHPCALCGKLGTGISSPMSVLMGGATTYQDVLMVYPTYGSCFELCNDCLKLLGSKAR